MEKNSKGKLMIETEIKCDMQAAAEGSLVGRCEGNLMIDGKNDISKIRCWRHVRMVEVWIRSCLISSMGLWEYLRTVDQEQLNGQIETIVSLRNWENIK